MELYHLDIVLTRLGQCHGHKHERQREGRPVMDRTNHIRKALVIE